MRAWDRRKHISRIAIETAHRVQRLGRARPAQSKEEGERGGGLGVAGGSVRSSTPSKPPKNKGGIVGEHVYFYCKNNSVRYLGVLYCAVKAVHSDMKLPGQAARKPVL